jgi:hypothetical protein
MPTKKEEAMTESMIVEQSPSTPARQKPIEQNTQLKPAMTAKPKKRFQIR